MDLGKQVGYLSGEEDKEPSRFGREGNGTQGKEVPSRLCRLTVCFPGWPVLYFGTESLASGSHVPLGLSEVTSPSSRLQHRGHLCAL